MKPLRPRARRRSALRAPDGQGGAAMSAQERTAMTRRTNRATRVKYLSTGVVLVLTIALAWALQKRQPHDFENRCYACHVGFMDPAILTRNADFLCLSCHPGQRKMSHPVGMIPNRAIPAQFPLYRQKVQCITCHTAHKTYNENDYEHKQLDSNPFFLRFRKPGKIFCIQCHSGESQVLDIKKTDFHALGFGKAHAMGHDVSIRDVLDDGSRDCLICHDGTLSQDTGNRVAGANWEHSAGIGVSHPIGIDYSASFFKSPRRLHNMSSVDKRIKLFQGKVGCQSCHSHFSKLPHMLVMENDGSRLCLQCHNV